MSKTALKSLLILFIAISLLVSLVFINKKFNLLSQNQQIKDCEISFILGGDLMMDRYIRTIGERKGYDYVFENISDYLKNSDGVIANLEGPITNYKSISQYSEIGSKENYIFTIDPQVLPILKQNNFVALNIGNNHIYNFGQTGVDQTKLYFDKIGIKYVGLENNPVNLNLKENILILFSYNQFYPKTDLEVLLSEISQADNGNGFIIVFAHWGNEYETEANPYYQDTAHQFIDAGADFIVGSHPHVVQQSEIYKDKYIYYSLGNFTADQYFSPETRKGLLLKVTKNCQNNNLLIEEKEVLMRENGQTTF